MQEFDVTSEHMTLPRPSPDIGPATLIEVFINNVLNCCLHPLRLWPLVDLISSSDVRLG